METKMLRKLLLAAVMLLAPPVAAQDTFKPGLPITDTNPAPRKSMCWSGTAYVICPTAGTTPRPTGASSDQVQGTAAQGAQATGNPNTTAGVDSTGAVKRFRTLPDGTQIIVDIDLTPVTVTPLASTGVLWSAATTGYAGVSYMTNTGWSGSTITFEGSNDSTDGTNGTWGGLTVQILGSATPTTQTQSPGAAFFIPAMTTYVRARVTAFSTGTVGGSAFLRSLAPMPVSNTINNNKSLWFTEANNIAVAIGANQNGTTRDTGVAAADYRYANWSCFVNPSVSSAGALLVAQGSLDNTTWVTTQAVSAAVAGQASTTQNGIFFRYNRCMFNNTGGASATNIYMMGRYSE
jgi:hypothetical protein